MPSPVSMTRHNRELLPAVVNSKTIRRRACFGMRFLSSDVSSLSSRFNLSSSSTTPAAWLTFACFFRIESEFVSGSVTVFKKFFPTAAFTIRRFSRAATLITFVPIILSSSLLSYEYFRKLGPYVRKKCRHLGVAHIFSATLQTLHL